MAIVKRHWKAFLLSLVLCVGLGGYLGFVIFHSTPALAQASEPEVSEPQPLDAVSYSQIRALRRQVCLTNEDLAAMGCGGEQAGVLLTAMRAWYEANRSQLDNVRAARNQAHQELRQAFREMNAGSSERSSSSIADLQAAVRQAEDAKVRLRDALMAYLSPALSTQQRDIWQAARDNRDVPGPYRYVSGLTPEDKQALAESFRLADASTAEVWVSVAPEDVLASSQMAEVDAIAASLRQDIAGVIEAANSSLPRD